MWHHAAATLTATWKLYLDGNLETVSCTTGSPPVAASCSPGVTPRSDSIQKVALGAMINSTQRPTAGRFQGVIDEARVWDHARTGPEILASKNSELTSGTGLVARWGLNEGTGTTVGDSIATVANGTITGTGYAWVAPPANTAPVAVADAYYTPLNTAKVVAAPGVLGNDTDANSDPLTAVLVTNVSHGVLALAANGGFTYTPTNGYNGPDSFTYKANDGTADSNTVTVSLAVGNNGLAAGHVVVRHVRRSGQARSRPVHDRDLVQADRDRHAEHDRHRRDHDPATPDPRLSGGRGLER